MDAVERMVSEHRLIEQVLDCLEAFAERLDRGEDVAEPGALPHCVRFLRGYADAIHHGKEEAILFAMLRQQGCSEFEPILQAIQREHEIGRNLVDDLAAVARRDTPWTPEQRARVVRAATSLVSMLRKHIREEDSYVFPEAQKLLSRAMAKRVQVAAERFEVIHEAQRAELEQLAHELSRGGPDRRSPAQQRAGQRGDR